LREGGTDRNARVRAKAPDPTTEQVP